MARYMQPEFAEDDDYNDVSYDEDLELVSVTTNYNLTSLSSSKDEMINNRLKTEGRHLLKQERW